MLVKVYNTVKVWLANINDYRRQTGCMERVFWTCWVPLTVDKTHNDLSYMGHRPKIYKISQLFLHSLFVIF